MEPKTRIKPIIEFCDREYYCLSNYSGIQVEWKGILWTTAEHAYQAAKFMHKADLLSRKAFKEVTKSKSSHEARLLANTKYRSQVDKKWSQKKLKIMEDICRHKLQQHSFVQEKLLQSGKSVLIENSDGTWHSDLFWGKQGNSGKNHMGKIWMKLRKELK